MHDRQHLLRPARAHEVGVLVVDFADLLKGLGTDHDGPGFPLGDELPAQFGHLLGEVVLLGAVVGEVEELGGVGAGVLDEFPVAVAEGGPVAAVEVGVLAEEAVAVTTLLRRS